MAESAVVVLLDKLVPWAQLAKEVKLSSGVRGEVENIRDELQSMRGFLRDADARGERDEALKAWVKQVREVAYDTEDVLDEFMLRLAQPPHRHGFIGFLHKASCNIKQLKARRHIANQIQEIKSRIHNISERGRRFDLTYLGNSSSSSSWSHLRGNALLLEEADVMGIDGPREQLVGWLLEDGPKLDVISVVGMGGLGKTTLVKLVYDDPRVKGSFPHHAWITISQSFNIDNLLKEMIRKLFNETSTPVPQDMNTMKDIDLKVFIKEFLLQKRYVIVLDDIWSIHAWEAIRYALPDGKHGSRIMITTRISDVAAFASVHHIYNLQPLPPEESWTLFCMKAFREAVCPQHLKDISLSILKRCAGLPLAIVAIGGVLSTKDKNKIDEWEIVQRSLGAALETNDSLKILSLSYNDLPHYLKSCFLYMGLFPEDYMIERNKLIRVWIAEGFVEEKARETPEEVAQSYLYDLINRNLIQVGGRAISGRIRMCRIHDLWRDIIISKLRDQNFGAIAEQLHVKLHEKVRRLSIHHDCQSLPSKKSLSHLRSLFVFGVGKLTHSSGEAFFGGFRLLRVLDLKGAPLETFPNEILNLFHLRYLSLRKTKIKMLPKSIDKLLNLETLDLKHAYVSELPIGILKLQKLRHLLMFRYSTKPGLLEIPPMQGFKAPMGAGRLMSLQKLYCVDVDQGSGIIRELGRLTQLRALRINKLRREDGADLCSSIENMKYLRSLGVHSMEKEVLLDLHCLSSSNQVLQRLTLEGRLDKFPDWISSLHNLSKLSLVYCGLKNDPLEALEALPNLVELFLVEAYVGEMMCSKAGGFQKLKYLYFRNFEGLKMVRVEEGAMPNLSELQILRCGCLERVPSGIERPTNLKKLIFFNMPDEFRTRVCTQEEDHWKVAHIPDIRFLNWTEGGWDEHRV